MEKVSSDEYKDVDVEYSLNSIYFNLVEKKGWNLKDIDETNLETLIDYLNFKPEKDPNIRIINGRQYHRAKGIPSWL